jgi:hypothetical protein
MCEARNLPIAAIAEYRPIICGDVPVRREYRCSLCRRTVTVNRISKVGMFEARACVRGLVRAASNSTGARNERPAGSFVSNPADGGHNGSRKRKDASRPVP